MRNSQEEMEKRRKMLYPSFHPRQPTSVLYIDLEQDFHIPNNSSFHFINDTLYRIVDIKWVKSNAIDALFKHLYIIHTDETIMKFGHAFSKNLITKIEFDEHKINTLFDAITF